MTIAFSLFCQFVMAIHTSRSYPSSSSSLLEAHRQLLGLVPQDSINLLHHLRRQLGHDGQAPDALANLLGPRRARDGGRDTRVLEHPGHGQAGLVAAEPVGDGLEPLDDGNLLCPILALEALLHHFPEGLARCHARVVRHAVRVLARQDAGAQGRKGRQAQADLVVEEHVVLFDALARQHVVLRLLHGRADQVESLGVAPGRGDFVGVPFRCAPVEDFARVDEVVDGADGLFEGRVAVGSVAVEQIDYSKKPILIP